MAFGSKGRRDEKVHHPAKDATSLLAQNVAIDGILRGDGLVRIEGTFDGEIHHEGHLVVAESAVVTASVDAYQVTVMGEVRGDITASGWLDLKPTAKVRGNIQTHRLTMAEGASLIGACDVESEEARRNRAAEEVQTDESPSPEDAAAV